jgi:hypothetical protein
VVVAMEMEVTLVVALEVVEEEAEIAMVVMKKKRNQKNTIKTRYQLIKNTA